LHNTVVLPEPFGAKKLVVFFLKMNRHERRILRTAPTGDPTEYPSISTAALLNNTTTKSIRKACLSGASFQDFNYCYVEIMIADEIWINHPTLPVECSDHGRIRFRKTRISCGGKNGVRASYLRVHIGKKWYLVHRLIAETFIENIEDKPTVDHIDRDRENNHIENLRWATYKEQQQNRSDRQ